MADFCKECSIEFFGKDTKDLAGINTLEYDKQGLYSMVLCENCGPTLVDTEGVCKSNQCEKHGK